MPSRHRAQAVRTRCRLGERGPPRRHILERRTGTGLPEKRGSPLDIPRRRRKAIPGSAVARGPHGDTRDGHGTGKKYRGGGHHARACRSHQRLRSCPWLRARASHSGGVRRPPAACLVRSARGRGARARCEQGRRRLHRRRIRRRRCQSDGDRGIPAGPRTVRNMGGGHHLRHGVDSSRACRRPGLPALRDGGALVLCGRLGLGERLRLGVGTVPLRTMGVPPGARLVVDSRAALRRRMGRLAHRPVRIRLRGMGSRTAGLVLVPRHGGGLVVRRVPSDLCVLFTDLSRSPLGGHLRRSRHGSP